MMTEELSSPFSHVFSLFEVNSADIVELARHARVDPSYSFSRADLRDVDLSHKNLEGYDFAHADLTGCCFTGASVFLADFSFATVDIGVLEAAEHGECAIWPNDIFAKLTVPSVEEVTQRTLRLAKGIHDRFSGPRRLVHLPLQIVGKTFEDPLYDLAVILDTMGGRIPTSLYFYASYVLARPLDYTVGFDSGVEWTSKETPPRFVQDALWMNEHRLTPAVAYGQESPDPGVFDLGSFFWREKNRARSLQISYATLRGNLDVARSALADLRAEAQLRDEPWTLVLTEIDQALLDVIDGASEDRVGQLLPEFKRRLPEDLYREAVGDVAWSLYLASIHLQSTSLRALLERLLETYGDVFWGDATKMGDLAIKFLSDCPGFWEIKRSPPIVPKKPQEDAEAGEGKLKLE